MAPPAARTDDPDGGAGPVPDAPNRLHSVTSLRPRRSNRAPARAAAAKPAPQKSVYDSLEQEMASLLGRPNSKT